MPNYDVRYRYTDQTGAVYAAKTVVDATDGDNAVSLARANISQRLPLNVVEIIGVAPSVAFGDTQDDIGLVQATSTAALSLGGADVIRGVGVASPVNFIEACQGATGTPGRVQLRAAGTDANISMVLTPKGTGALIAQIPNSLASGGNARGANAVDWQTVRSAANQVASGANATVSGGQGNLANSTNSTVGGGASNTANANNATIAGGNQNIASNSFATVGGGNVNVASGFGATIGGGNQNTASGIYSWSPGGFQASARGIFGLGCWSPGQIAAVGDAQSEEHIIRRQTTDATPTRLTADGAAANTTNTINLANFSAIAGVLVVRARGAGGVNLSATWFINLSATRDGSAASVLIEGGGGTALTPTHSRGTGSAWRIDVTADTTNGGIAVTVTGAAATTINWVARFAAAQVQTAS